MSVKSGTETTTIMAFLQRVGFSVRQEPIVGETFLPGLAIRRGALVVDEARLLYPGDLLHEAGHLAVMTPEERAHCDGDAGPDAGAEIAAIAWSYAAALEMGLDPLVVFHADGYKAGGFAILENFAQGRYIGVPLLAWFGLTTDPAGKDVPTNAVPYPKMRQWLRTRSTDISSRVRASAELVLLDER